MCLMALSCYFDCAIHVNDLHLQYTLQALLCLQHILIRSERLFLLHFFLLMRYIPLVAGLL